jgi:hypothetical protein
MTSREPPVDPEELVFVDVEDIPHQGTSNDSWSDRISAPVQALMQAQVPLQVAADDIEAIALAQDSAGFGGLELDVSSREIRIYLTGETPRSLTEMMRHLSQQDITVRVLSAQYTREELREQADALFDNRGEYPGLHRVSVNPDGSGLEVGVTPSEARAFRSASVPVPVFVEAEERFELYACRTGASRCRVADVAPYWGGASVSAFNGGGCSTAFAVIKPSLLDPSLWERMMLTAAHCGGGVGVNYFGGKGLMGRGALWDRRLDSAAIATSSAPRIYDGGVNDASEYSKPVTAQGVNRKGVYVCTSGASSGVHCDIRIKSTENSVDWGDYDSKDVVFADQVDKLAAAGDGDSGGPVFTLSADPSKVVAMGVIIGGGKQSQFPAPCTYKSSKCSSRLLYTDLIAILRKHGLRLIVQP